MTIGSVYRFAGWFVLDGRLAFFVLGLSLLVTFGTLALFYRERRWHELFSIGFTVFVLFAGGVLLLLNTILSYPVFRIESFFPFP